MSVTTIKSSKNPTARRALALAAAFTLLGVGSTLAQVSANQSGSASDSNRAVGSGGSNTVGGSATGSYGAYGNDYNYGGNYGSGYGSYGNSLVTGNVTGGAAFRGDVGYGDPRSFRDDVGGSSFDAFNRGASGVSTGGQVFNYAQTFQPYYGDTTVTQPPAGFVRTPGSGGYTPARFSGFSADLSDLQALRRSGDQQTAEQIQTPLSRLFAGGAADVDLDAQIDAGARARLVPEALVNGGRFTGYSDRASLADAEGRNLSPYTRLGRNDRLREFDGGTLRALNDELLRDAAGNRVQVNDVESLLNPAGLDDGQPEDGQQPGQEGQAGNLTDGSSGLDEIERAARPTGELAPEDDPVLKLADPAEQSEQYAQLRERLERFEHDPYAEALRPRGMAREQQEQAGQPALPGFDGIIPGMPGFTLPPMLDGEMGGDDGADGEFPPAGAQPGGAGGGMEVGPADPPVAVRSFSAGVTSPTLKRLLDEAEVMMADGKFISAIARYSAAERLVPNQPLVSLGRVTAELGAGYYRRAAGGLRGVLSQNPELTMARVDVVALLGEQRVEVIAEDLRKLAEEDPNSVEPLFLLAYLSYGSGRYSQAAALLDVAQTRSEDPFYQAVKRMWALDARPAGAPPTSPTSPTSPQSEPAEPAAQPDLEMNK